MVENASGAQNPEVSKIILAGTDNAVEVRAGTVQGEVFLNGIRTVLEAAIDGGLLTVAPFLLNQPETTLPTPEQLVKRPAAPTMITVERTLELTTVAYRAKPDSPELLSEFNQAFWSARQQAMGVSQADLVVADCPYSEAGIRKFVENDFGLFVPRIVSTVPEGLILLGKAFPQMGSLAFQERARVLNIDKNGNLIDICGWMTTEKAIDTPYTRTNQNQAEKIVGENHRIGDTLNVYAAAGQQSEKLTGQYLDEGRTWIRILSSRSGGRVLIARFASSGYCRVDWLLGPGDVGDDLGVRSVETAKT